MDPSSQHTDLHAVALELQARRRRIEAERQQRALKLAEGRQTAGFTAFQQVMVNSRGTSSPLDDHRYTSAAINTGIFSGFTAAVLPNASVENVSVGQLRTAPSPPVSHVSRSALPPPELRSSTSFGRQQDVRASFDSIALRHSSATRDRRPPPPAAIVSLAALLPPEAGASDWSSHADREDALNNSRQYADNSISDHDNPSYANEQMRSGHSQASPSRGHAEYSRRSAVMQQPRAPQPSPHPSSSPSATSISLVPVSGYDDRATGVGSNSGGRRGSVSTTHDGVGPASPPRMGRQQHHHHHHQEQQQPPVVVMATTAMPQPARALRSPGRASPLAKPVLGPVQPYASRYDQQYSNDNEDDSGSETPVRPANRRSSPSPSIAFGPARDGTLPGMDGATAGRLAALASPSRPTADSNSSSGGRLGASPSPSSSPSPTAGRSSSGRRFSNAGAQANRDRSASGYDNAEEEIEDDGGGRSPYQHQYQQQPSVVPYKSGRVGPLLEHVAAAVEELSSALAHLGTSDHVPSASSASSPATHRGRSSNSIHSPQSRADRGDDDGGVDGGGPVAGLPYGYGQGSEHQAQHISRAQRVANRLDSIRMRKEREARDRKAAWAAARQARDAGHGEGAVGEWLEAAAGSSSSSGRRGGGMSPSRAAAVLTSSPARVTGQAALTAATAAQRSSASSRGNGSPLRGSGSNSNNRSRVRKSVIVVEPHTDKLRVLEEQQRHATTTPAEYDDDDGAVHPGLTEHGVQGHDKQYYHSSNGLQQLNAAQQRHDDLADDDDVLHVARGRSLAEAFAAERGGGGDDGGARDGPARPGGRVPIRRSIVGGMRASSSSGGRHRQHHDHGSNSPNPVIAPGPRQGQPQPPTGTPAAASPSSYTSYPRPPASIASAASSSARASSRGGGGGTARGMPSSAATRSRATSAGRNSARAAVAPAASSPAGRRSAAQGAASASSAAASAAATLVKSNITYSGVGGHGGSVTASNRQKVANALQFLCLAGPHRAVELATAMAALKGCDSANYLLLLASPDSLSYRGLYSHEPHTGTALRLHGSGPMQLTGAVLAAKAAEGSLPGGGEDDDDDSHSRALAETAARSTSIVDCCYKYATASRSFALIHSRSPTLTTDAVTIKQRFTGS